MTTTGSDVAAADGGEDKYLCVRALRDYLARLPAATHINLSARGVKCVALLYSDDGGVRLLREIASGTEVAAATEFWNVLDFTEHPWSTVAELLALLDPLLPAHGDAAVTLYKSRLDLPYVVSLDSRYDPFLLNPRRADAVLTRHAPGDPVRALALLTTLYGAGVADRCVMYGVGPRWFWRSDLVERYPGLDGKLDLRALFPTTGPLRLWHCVLTDAEMLARYGSTPRASSSERDGAAAIPSTLVLATTPADTVAEASRAAPSGAEASQAEPSSADAGSFADTAGVGRKAPSYWGSTAMTRIAASSAHETPTTQGGDGSEIGGSGWRIADALWTAATDGLWMLRSLQRRDVGHIMCAKIAQDSNHAFERGRAIAETLSAADLALFWEAQAHNRGATCAEDLVHRTTTECTQPLSVTATATTTATKVDAVRTASATVDAPGASQRSPTSAAPLPTPAPTPTPTPPPALTPTPPPTLIPTATSTSAAAVVEGHAIPIGASSLAPAASETKPATVVQITAPVSADTHTATTAPQMPTATGTAARRTCQCCGGVITEPDVAGGDKRV